MKTTLSRKLIPVKLLTVCLLLAFKAEASRMGKKDELLFYVGLVILLIAIIFLPMFYRFLKRKIKEHQQLQIKANEEHHDQHVK